LDFQDYVQDQKSELRLTALRDMMVLPRFGNESGFAYQVVDWSKAPQPSRSKPAKAPIPLPEVIAVITPSSNELKPESNKPDRLKA
jgi:hypothetical protein